MIRRLKGGVRAHPVASSLGAAAFIGVAVWLVFFVFAFHLLFIDDKVDEANPFAVSSPSATSPASVGGSPPTTSPASAGGSPPTTVAVAARETHRGMFVDRSHPASGVATVITDGSKSFLRFEDFETDNGPDLFVYLSAGVTATSPAGALDDDFVNLGKLKGNIGAQNYELPAGTDLAKYKTVVIWCKRFTTAFGTSDLAGTTSPA
jgi:hypothetical protein